MAEITNPERIETQVYTFQTFLPGTATPVALYTSPSLPPAFPQKNQNVEDQIIGVLRWNQSD